MYAAGVGSLPSEAEFGSILRGYSPWSPGSTAGITRQKGLAGQSHLTHGSQEAGQRGCQRRRGGEQTLTQAHASATLLTRPGPSGVCRPIRLTLQPDPMREGPGAEGSLVPDPWQLPRAPRELSRPLGQCLVSISKLPHNPEMDLCQAGSWLQSPLCVHPRRREEDWSGERNPEMHPRAQDSMPLSAPLSLLP